MRKAVLCVCTVATLWLTSGAVAAAHSPATPGCVGGGAKECVGLALEAMGGRERLQQVKSVRFDTMGHTLLVEESYRQEPFITSYERDRTTLDLVNHRLLTEATQTWPELSSTICMTRATSWNAPARAKAPQGSPPVRWQSRAVLVITA